jgi:hypothetical protein
LGRGREPVVLESTLIKAFKPTQVGTEGVPWHPFTPYSDQVLLKLLHIRSGARWC